MQAAVSCDSPLSYIAHAPYQSHLHTTFSNNLVILFLSANAVCSLDAAKAGKPLPDEDLTKEVYSTADHKSEHVDFIRMPDYHKSIGTKL